MERKISKMVEICDFQHNNINLLVIFTKLTHKNVQM